MKVRHKQHGKVWEVLDQGDTFYVVCESVYNPQIQNCGEAFAVSKKDYEPVPPPDRWQDVTNEVVITDRQYQGFGGKGSVVNEAGCFHNGVRLTHNVCGGAYRIRKVMLSPDHGVPAWQWAFLVERKVSG